MYKICINTAVIHKVYTNQSKQN